MEVWVSQAEKVVVSDLQNETVVEMGCSTVWVYLTLLSCALRNAVHAVKMVNFMSHVCLPQLQITNKLI